MLNFDLKTSPRLRYEEKKSHIEIVLLLFHRKGEPVTLLIQFMILMQKVTCTVDCVGGARLSNQRTAFLF